MGRQRCGKVVRGGREGLRVGLGCVTEGGEGAGLMCSLLEDEGEGLDDVGEVGDSWWRRRVGGD